MDPKPSPPYSPTALIMLCGSSINMWNADTTIHPLLKDFKITYKCYTYKDLTTLAITVEKEAVDVVGLLYFPAVHLLLFWTFQ